MFRVGSLSKSSKRSSRSGQSSRRASTASNEQSSTRSPRDGGSKTKPSQQPPGLKAPPTVLLSSSKHSSAATPSIGHVNEETRGRPNKREADDEWTPVEDEGSPVVTNEDHPPNTNEQQAGSEV